MNKWKPTIRIQLREPSTPVYQPVLFQFPEPQEPLCNHVAAGRDFNRNLFSNSIDELCARCGAKVQSNP